MGKQIKIHIHPNPLMPGDNLTDGEEGKEFEISESTLLIWIDLIPGAKFAHPTTYILISSQETKVEQGRKWPVLNGKKILYGETNNFTSPIDLNTLL